VIRLVKSVVLVALIAGMIGMPGPAEATQHNMYIDEIFGGVGYAPTAQFLELRMWSGGQNNVLGADVTTFDGNGAQVATEEFADDAINGAKGSSILVGTAAAEDLFDVPLDLEFDTDFLTQSGKACFGPSTSSFYDCVTWGNYTGSQPQSPANNPEGLVQGASFHRTYGNNGIDGTDDHNNNRRDFLLDTPTPRNNNGLIFVASQRIRFSGDPVAFPETTLATIEIPIVRGPDTTGPVDVSFATSNGTAEGNDYTDADDIVTFSNGVGNVNVGVNLNNNDQFEGPETVILTIRGPTSPAYLGRPMNSRITITDFEDDEESPTSRITKPDHGQSYKPSRLGKLRGTSDDGVGVVDVVKVALRQTRTDGSCKWFNGNRFVNRACGNKMFVDSATEPNGDWGLSLGDPLKKSAGTNVRFYTAYSKAHDSGIPAANVETGFDTGRNANRFEIR
jgi:Calx-beta domain